MQEAVLPAAALLGLHATEELHARANALSRRAPALAVATQISMCRKIAPDVLAVQIWLFTLPRTLYSVKKYIAHAI